MDISPENIQVVLLNDFVPNPNVINHNNLIVREQTPRYQLRWTVAFMQN
jgi:hypothetical protein